MFSDDAKLLFLLLVTVLAFAAVIVTACVLIYFGAFHLWTGK